MVTETDRNKARSAVVKAYHALDCVTIQFSFLHALADAAVDAVSTDAEPDGWICEDEFTLEPDLACKWEDEGFSPKPFYFSHQQQNSEPVAKTRSRSTADQIDALQTWSEQKYGQPFSVSACHDLLNALTDAEPVKTPFEVASKHIPEARVSLLSRAIRQGLNDYGWKNFGTLPEVLMGCIVEAERAEAAVHPGRPRDCGVDGGDLSERRDNIGSAYTRSTLSAQVQDVAGSAELIRMVDIAENRLVAIHKALHPEMHGINGIESPEDHVAYMVSVLQAAYDGVTASPASKHGDAE